MSPGFDPMGPLDPETYACTDGPACPDDCDGECQPRCPRCDALIDPLQFACPACAHNPFSRFDGAEVAP